LKEELGVDALLLKGHSGIFQVEVDGKVVASKGRDGFPTPEAVVDAVAKALPATARG
jgi:selenoprotein W-related protein